jgi:cephalosporin hydroxylase
LIDTYIDLEASVRAMSAQGCLLFGVPAIKGLEDLHRYSIVIDATRPDLVLQTGTAVGGSAVWLAHQSIRYPGPDVVTIDVDGDRIDGRVLDDDKITVLTGSSTDEAMVEAARMVAESHERVMVVLDSDHSVGHVVREIDLYGPMVTPGCYLVVEDGIYDFTEAGAFRPGPLRAIESRLVGNDQWRRDIEIEALEPISMYPAGWWRRL